MLNSSLKINKSKSLSLQNIYQNCQKLSQSGTHRRDSYKLLPSCKTLFKSKPLYPSYRIDKTETSKSPFYSLSRIIFFLKSNLFNFFHSSQRSLKIFIFGTFMPKHFQKDRRRHLQYPHPYLCCCGEEKRGRAIITENRKKPCQIVIKHDFYSGMTHNFIKLSHRHIYVDDEIDTIWHQQIQ